MAIGPQPRSSNADMPGIAISAPVAAGQIDTISLPVGLYSTVTDIGLDFGGGALSFALAPSSDPLPDGLTLDAGGMLFGTPTEAVSRAVVVRGTNTEGHADSAFVLATYALEMSASMSGLTANPEHGACAQSGAVLSAGAAFNGPPPGGVSYQWKTVEGGAIAGASGVQYVPDAGTHDLQSLYCTVSAAPYPDADTAVAVIRHVPPVVAGSLDEEILDLGDGPMVIAAGAALGGQALVYSVTGPGCSIDTGTGQLTIQTNSATAGALVTVAAVNSGGRASVSFPLTVEDPAYGPGPDISVPVLDEAANAISLTVSEAATLYWRRDPTGFNPDAGQVMAGGGHDSGSAAVGAGANAITIVFAGGHDGMQEISFVAAVIAQEPSNVRTVAIEIDTVDPVVAGSVPAAGAVLVAADVQPAVTFSEAVAFGSGEVTLYDVDAGAAREVFDVVADAGGGAGQVEIAGAVLTIRPSLPLEDDTDYAILIDAGAVRDLAGNGFAGIAGTGVLGFSTDPGGPVFADSVVTPSFTAAAWGSRTVEPDGWWITPEAAAHADTIEGDFAAPSVAGQPITAVVDVRLTSGAGSANPTMRLWNVTTATYGNTSISLPSGTVTPGGALSAGAVDLNGDQSVWRVWIKITGNAGNRILAEFPSTSNTFIDLRNPAIFYGDLSVAEITGLS